MYYIDESPQKARKTKNMCVCVCACAFKWNIYSKGIKRNNPDDHEVSWHVVTDMFYFYDYCYYNKLRRAFPVWTVTHTSSMKQDILHQG